MTLGFWNKLEKPFFVLAPMADVTDCVFRQLIAETGKVPRTDGSRGGPDVTWTEFVSADGLDSPGKEKLLIDFKYSEIERPIVAQIFSGNPEKIERAAGLVEELGFDGVDINMGCPDRAVEKQRAGAALIKDVALAKELIRAAKRGAPHLPVSVKTRIGYNKEDIDVWIPALLEEGLAALTIHLRTRKEMSDVEAHWELLPRVVALRDRYTPETLIIGNGDAKDLADARLKVETAGADGVMLGRAIFGNPWLWSEKVPGISEKLRMLVEHTRRFENELGSHKNFAIMKKHFKAYVSGFDGAKELRTELMECEDADAVAKRIEQYLASTN